MSAAEQLYGVSESKQSILRMVFIRETVSEIGFDLIKRFVSGRIYSGDRRIRRSIKSLCPWRDWQLWAEALPFLECPSSPRELQLRLGPASSATALDASVVAACSKQPKNSARTAQ